MKYESIKDFNKRCEEHPAHQTGMISHQMIQERLSEEIDELREYIEKRTWVGLTDEDLYPLANKYLHYQIEDYLSSGVYNLAHAIEAKLKEKNT
jgi:hypothetical protein